MTKRGLVTSQLHERPWKERLYDGYASSGQAAPAAHDQTAEQTHLPRRPYFMRLIAKHMPKERSARIADLGCGNGVFLHFLSRAGYHNTLGFDVSAEQIATAHRLGAQQARHCDMETFFAETEDASVDVVLLMDVLEHLTRDDLFRTLDQVFRVLRDGGLCIAHVPNGQGVYGMGVRYGDLTHEQAFTSKSVSQLCRTIGFRSASSYEEPPLVYSLTSFARRVVWSLATSPHRLMLAAELGKWDALLSQNLLFKAVK